MATYSDTFDRPNEDPIVGYSSQSGFFARIVSNEAAGNAAADYCPMYHAGTVGTAQRAKAVIAGALETNTGDLLYGSGPAIFMQPGGATVEKYSAIGMTGQIDLVKVGVEGWQTTLLGQYLGTVSLGDEIEIRGTVVGATVELEVFQNGVSRLTATDSTDPYLTGHVGFTLFTANVVQTIASWEGGDIEAAPPTGEETWHPTESAASGASHGALSLTPPSDATSATGWTVGATAADSYARMAFGLERAAATFGATVQPNSGPDAGLGDCFRTPDAKSGTYAAGDWTFAFGVRAVTMPAGQDGRIRVRLWKSSNADGSGATEITTSGVALSEVLNLLTSADGVSSGTIALGAVTLANEYLFVQVAWHITGVPDAAAGPVPTLVGSGAFASSQNALNVSWPAHATGDLGVLVVETANQPVAAPAGWTEVANSPQGTGAVGGVGGVSVSVYIRFAASASESDAAVGDSGNHTTGQIHVFRGVHPTTPVNASAGSTGSSGSVVLPGVTTTVANCLILHCLGLDRDAASTANISGYTNASLANLTELHDQTVTTAAGGGIAVASGEMATAGATGTTSATAATTGNRAHVTIALAPADIDSSLSDVLLRVGAGSSIATPVFTEGGGETFTRPRPLVVMRQALHRASRW